MGGLSVPGSLCGIPASLYLEQTVRLDDGKKINFKDYRAYAPLLDMPIMKEVIFLTGRQVGKSSFMVSNTLKFAHVPNFRMSYIAPIEMQMTDFSTMKLGLTLKNSPIIRNNLLSTKSPLLGPRDKIDSSMLKNDVRLKVFATGASLKLGYASDAIGVNRIRGGSSDLLMMDEGQSSDLDNVMPVVLPVLDSSDYGIVIYAGTPLDESDPLTTRFHESSQHTMVVKCPHCNRYTTLMHLKQISYKGVLCFHCSRPVDIRTGKFVAMNPGAKKVGFHINKLMFPGVVYHPIKWPLLVDKVQDPRANISKIMMEDLGIPMSTATKLLTKAEILSCATEKGYDPYNFRQALEGIRMLPQDTLVYSIDWGGGADDLGAGAGGSGSSRTAETLWVVRVEMGKVKMYLKYHRIYPLANVKACVEELYEHVKLLPDKTLLTADYLGGAFGNSSIHRYVASVAKSKKLVFLTCQLTEVADVLKISELGDRVSIDRNRLLPKFFHKVIHKDTHFPKDTALIEEIASNYLAAVEIENELGKRMWRKRKGTVDDILYSSVFAWVVYCLKSNYQAELLA